MKQGAPNVSLEEFIFKTLSHKKLRDILRVIGEKEKASFTEIKNSVGTEDSPSLSYHLNALDGLIVQQEGYYQLSELGGDAYNLIRKTATYIAKNSLIDSLRKSLALAIIANAILWAAAIFSVSEFEGRPNIMTLSSFAGLWFISNIMIYYILNKTRNN